jgi:hypothetical protein
MIAAAAAGGPVVPKRRTLMNDPFCRYDIARLLTRRSRKMVFWYVKQWTSRKFDRRKALKDAFSTLVNLTAQRTSEIIANERLKRVIDGKPELRC